MNPEKTRKLLKRIAFAGSFFALAFVFYLLGRDGSAFWRGVLIAYALFVTVILVLAILLQSGRGGGLAGLGGAAGDSLLGARAATPIAKATYVLGALFLFICMLIARLGYVSSNAPQYLPDSSQTIPAREQPVEDAESLPADGTGQKTSSARPNDNTEAESN
jgi:preprotein translocase subunit SecG